METAFTALGEKPRISTLPPAVLSAARWVTSLVSPRRADTLRIVSWGKLNDSVGEPTGTHHLADFFATHARSAAGD